MAGCHVELGSALKTKNPENRSLIKHMTLNSLLHYKRLGKGAGNMILACDSKNYWRKEKFPAYKGHREAAKDASPIDWDTIYAVIDELKKDLSESFPYYVLEVPGAEADDIIAVLTKYFQTNETVTEGLFDAEPQPVNIFSSDGDFAQLQKYKGVRQWSPLQKKWIKPANAAHLLMEHICTGDGGDNVPNICTPTQWAIDRALGTPSRAVSFMRDRLDDFYKKGIDACANEAEKANFLRNKMLVDFDSIPKEIEDKILQAYIQCKPTGSKMKIMNFLIKNRMKLLMQNINDF
jgi:hypothetical protein